jgi:hypothetical protein
MEMHTALQNETVNIHDHITVTAENAGVSAGIHCYVNVITVAQHTALRQAALCVHHVHLFL